MKTWVAVLCVATLSACGTAIESADRDHVSIRFNNYADSPVSLRPLADEHCASFDRVASYESTSSGEGLLGFLTGLPLEARYACRTPYSAS
ncbi:MAG: hypothetical protein R3285_09005 [Kiloniellales bacterium]|nr:hypothetical protein [Kiloniellales bacterium]